MCDPKCSAVILFQGSQVVCGKAVLIRSGDVIMGTVSLSKSGTLLRAREKVTLELIEPENLVLVQRFMSKHDDVATLRQYVESVAFPDLDKRAQVLIDSRYDLGLSLLFGFLDSHFYCAEGMCISLVTEIAKCNLKNSSLFVALKNMLHYKN